MVRKSRTVFMDLEITHGRVASEELGIASRIQEFQRSM